MWEHPVSSISRVYGCVKHTCIETGFYKKKSWLGWGFFRFFFCLLTIRTFYVRINTQLTYPTFCLAIRMRRKAEVRQVGKLEKLLPKTERQGGEKGVNWGMPRWISSRNARNLHLVWAALVFCFKSCFSVEVILLVVFLFWMGEANLWGCSMITTLWKMP